MTQNKIETHIQTAQEALATLLKQLIGTEVPLDASAPARVSPEPDSIREALSDRVELYTAESGVIVALAPDWVPLLSEGMLGEAVEPDSDAAADLIQEIASQGFGTIQSTLAAEGLELPTLEFAAVGPGETGDGVDALDGPVWRVSFSAEHEGTTLDGFALLPAEDASSDDETPAPDAAQGGSDEAAPERDEDGAAADTSSEVEVSPAAFSDLGEETIGGDGGGEEALSNFELLAEVNLEVRVELGRRELPLADVLKLTTGSVIELEKMVGEPLSVYANGRLIAEGEAVVIDEQFGVRITNLASEGRRDKAFF